MRFRRINVKRHKRHLQSGKTIHVKRHKRRIKMRAIPREPISRERIKREFISPTRDITLIDPEKLTPSQYEIEFVSGQREGIQKEAPGELRVFLGTRAKARAGERLEDRISKRDLKKYMILTKKILLTDPDGNVMYDENNEAIYEETPLVLPPLPVPGQLDPDEIYEFKKVGDVSGFGVEIDPITSLPIFKRIMISGRGIGNWVIFDRFGQPILADHVSIYAIKGVDAEVGDFLISKYGIHTVGDYMEWRQKLASKKIKDEEDLEHSLMQQLDEYNADAVLSKLREIHRSRLELGRGDGTPEQNYAELAYQEVERELGKEEIDTVSWLDRMEQAVARQKLRKERDIQRKTARYKKPRRKGIGGRPKLVTNLELDEQKKAFKRIRKEKLKRGQDTAFEDDRLNMINHELKIRKLKTRIEKIDYIVNLDSFGRFLVGSSYIKIPSNATKRETQKIYNKKYKTAKDKLDKKGSFSVGKLSYYPKKSEELTKKPLYPEEITSDILIIDHPPTKRKTNWHYAEIRSIQNLKPTRAASKKGLQIMFEGKKYYREAKIKHETGVMGSRQQFLRDGTSYFKKSDIQSAYGSAEQENKPYELAEDAGLKNQSYIIRGQLKDRDDKPTEHELFKGSSLIFETKEAFITVDPIFSHYGRPIRNEKIKNELKKRIK